MKQTINASVIALAGVLTVGLFSASTYAQAASSENQNSSTPQTQNTSPAPVPGQNLPAQLNFTPQQIQQWRQINRDFRGQEMDAALKLRQTRAALNEAMEATNPDEALIKQRAKDVADAQSALTQLQALRQARVLQILTPEQRAKLKEIRQQAQAMRREQGGNGLNRRELRRNGNAQALTPSTRKLPQDKQKR